MVQYMGNTMLVSVYRLAFWLASFQPAASRRLEALRAPVDPAQQQASEPCLDFCLGYRLQPHRPAAQAGADKYLRAFPFDHAVLVDSPAVHSRIGKVAGTALIFSRRPRINFPRTFHPQRLMRPFVVKLLPPQIQRLLFGRPRLQFRSDVTVHSFMRPVVLRMSRPASFQIDQPPHRQPAQAKERLGMRKGCAIVTPDGTGQAMPLKQTLKTQ